MRIAGLTDDILKLLSALDAAQVTLPTFVSVDLSRVPPINPGDVDVCSLAMNVEYLHKQMNSMASRLLTVENHTRAAAELANTSTTAMNSDDDWPTLPGNGMPGNFKGVGKDHPFVDRAGHCSAAVDPVGEASLKFTEMFLMKDTKGEWFPVKRKVRSSLPGYVKSLVQENQIKLNVLMPVLAIGICLLVGSIPIHLTQTDSTDHRIRVFSCYHLPSDESI